MNKEQKNHFVYITSYVGNLGTKILIDRKKDLLKEHFSESFLDKIYVECGGGQMPPFKFEYIDSEDINKGGVLASLWRICDRNKLGLRYNLSDIPVHQGTIEICNFFDLNPYRLMTEGSKVIISDEEIEGLFLIGETNDKKQRIRIDGEVDAFLTKCYKDEIDKIK